MSQVELRHLSKGFGNQARLAVDGIDLLVHPGERFVILGPSGSGKTTLLRLIAGLEQASAGEVWINGKQADSLAPRHRGVGMVFQQPALYPHLSVGENLAFGLRSRGVETTERRKRVLEVAGWLGLAALLDRKPNALSGGERQRVAIGRAVITRRGVLLLDEPFSSLDAPLRASTREILLDLHGKVGGSLIMVTHDQTEAMAIGDRIAVMRAGRLEGVGTPTDLYDSPPNAFVAGFLGDPPMTLLPAVKSNGRLNLIAVEADESLVDFAVIDPSWRDGKGLLGIRPESIAIGVSNQSATRFPAVIERVESRGHELVMRLCVGGHSLVSRALRGAEAWRVGDRIEVGLDLNRACWFPSESC